MTGFFKDRLALSFLALLATFAIGIAYLFGAVLKTPLTHSPPSVVVELQATGGLFEAAPVTYRGVRVGTVRDIGIEDDGQVFARIELRDSVRVPRETTAVVRSLSPVGEQFLDFQPVSPDGPFLADGDRIEATATDIPVALASSAEELSELLGAVDKQDLRVVLRELSLAMAGSDDDLERILASTDEVATTLDEAWPQTQRLLENGETVGEILARHEHDLRTFSVSAKELTAWLEDFDPEFRRILRDASPDLDQVTVLMNDLAVLLPPFLRQLYRLGDLAYDREPHLRELTRMLPRGIGAFASAFRDGWLHINLNIQGQDQCQYDQAKRDPTTDKREPLNHSGHCTSIRRGASHAPPPLDR